MFCCAAASQEAHDKLQQALRSLDSSLDVGSTDQNPAASAGSAGSGSTQLQLQQTGADGDMQLHLRWDRGTTVHSVGLITTSELLGSKPNLWVGLKWSTEFLPGCNAARKGSEPVQKVSGYTQLRQ